ncbi:phosphate/phosphite/phosphonate ABC transporter substrate-binding protein [Bdellovibrio svalbardensis]|uniref:Phosphate/phosphite/phosphonate ABC transporter substrate-binding protein n=1 Tax=Bdellovibrio svalbardensis TaxID=2972972 RepID=A0ABT6DIY0_9BACT|nr:phosphate/phosphite/phosphonate ABC transporter substrate-binding protein [Bdellovibrio svalbardensis]MDG0816726.1 phosphate/phosphite/phosphonate ABC transporter substrate-binding protein [Bdellovibrio svalbardensis]
MIKQTLLALASVLFFSSAQAQTLVAAVEKAPSEITIGVIPGGNPEILREQGLALAKELQAKINIPVNIYVSKNYAGLVEAMKTKKVDFAFFSSSTYVHAEEQAQAKVLLKKVWNHPYYYATVIVPVKSKIKKLEDLKGKTIAFVDEQSSSGYLYPKVALQKKGLNDKSFKEVIFSGNHSASVQLLEAHKVDAAAVFSDDEQGKEGAWIQFGAKQKYRIIWKSAPIPNDPFCVRQDFYDEYPKITHTLMFALIDILDQATDKKIYSEILGTQTLMPATSKQYDPVKEMVKALNIELKP